MTGGSTVAKGKVIAGTTGRAGGGNFIVALDANTGPGSVALQHDPEGERAGRQHLERRAVRQAQRRVGLGGRQLRPGD